MVDHEIIIKIIVLQEGVYDADTNVNLLHLAVDEGGVYCIVLCDALLPAFPMG